VFLNARQMSRDFFILLISKCEALKKLCSKVVDQRTFQRKEDVIHKENVNTVMVEIPEEAAHNAIREKKETK